MKNIYHFVFMIILCFPTLLKAQNTIFYEGDYKPLIIWVFPAEMQEQVYQKIGDLKDYKRRKYRLNDVIATAQFTLCNSLIKYFKDLENEKKHYHDLKDKEALETLKLQLLADWESLKKDPYFLI